MAGDPAFSQQANGNPTPAAAPAAAPAPDTRYDALAARVEQIGQGLGRLVGILERQAATAQKPAEPTPPNQVAQRLLEDPEATFNSMMQSWYEKNVAPVQRLQMGDQADALLREERSAFDSQYGEGQFDKLILPGFTRTLEQMGDQSRVVSANRSSVRTIVDSVKGQNYAAVRAAEDAKAKADAEAAAANPPAMPPYLVGTPFGVRPAPNELTPAEETMIARAKHVAGDEFSDRAELMALREAWGTGKLSNAQGGERGVSVDSTRTLMQTIAGASKQS